MMVEEYKVEPTPPELSAEKMGEVAQAAGETRDGIRGITKLLKDLFPAQLGVDVAKQKIEGMTSVRGEVKKGALAVLDFVQKGMTKQAEKLSAQASKASEASASAMGEATKLQATEADLAGKTAEDVIAAKSVAAQYPGSDFDARPQEKKKWGLFRREKTSEDQKKKAEEFARKAGEHARRSADVMSWANKLGGLIKEMRGEGDAEMSEQVATQVDALQEVNRNQAARIQDLEQQLQSLRDQVANSASVVGGTEFGQDVVSNI